MKKRQRAERIIRITDRDRMVASLVLKDGKSIREACIMAGYKESVANKGRAAITRGIKAAMLEFKGEQYAWMGAQLRANPELMHDTVVGWLYQSMLDRNTKGVAAAKLMGMHKAVDMFVKDGEQNVLVIQAPSEFTGLTNGNIDARQLKDAPKALPPADADLPDYD